MAIFTTTSVCGVYVLNGNLEIGISYNMSKAKNDTDSDLDFNIDGLSFGGYYHMKDNETLPMNIKVGGYYGNAKVSADWFDDAGLELKSNASAFGGGVYKNIYQKDAMTIMGFFNFHSVTTEVTFSGSLSETDDNEFTSTSFGLAVRSGNLFVTPSISKVDGESEFNIRFGFLLPQ